MRYLKWIIPLTLLYLGLTGNIEPLNWVLGLLLALFITLLLQPDPAPTTAPKLIRAVNTGILFFIQLLRDLWVSSIQVSKLILKNDPNLKQGFFTLSSESSNPLVNTLSAHAITLTPGEMVVEIEPNGTMHIHSLDVPTSRKTASLAQQKRTDTLETITA